MFLKRLRQATSGRHRALECQLPLLDPRLSRQSYHRIVSRFFGYYEPLEARLLSLPWWHEIGVDYAAERRKTPRLESDLIALGETPEGLARLPRCAELPAVASIPQVFRLPLRDRRGDPWRAAHQQAPAGTPGSHAGVGRRVLQRLWRANGSAAGKLSAQP
jgi:hypothetical protein